MPAKTRNKYRAKKTVVDGITFDSKKEAERYSYLKQLRAAGAISDLCLQPKFPFIINGEPVRIRSAGFPNGRAVKYVADFAYFDNGTQQRVIEDVKGMDTPVSRLKRALVESLYGFQVRLV